MPPAIKFYTNPMSRGRIVRWMLEEVGQPYDTEILGYGTPMKGETYRKINPMGKVPAIVHNGQTVTECAAICAYLADAFPQAGLAPAPNQRSAYYRWLFFAAGPLEAAITNKALVVRVPDDKRAMVGYGSFDDVMNTLEQAIARKRFIAGESFTAADVYVGSHIGFGMAFNSIEKRPAFVEYHQGLAARPAFQKAAALDDEAMKATASR
jgi:glutathione S-transferase